MNQPPAPSQNPAWAELVQLVPVITLASSFLVSGEVDLGRAGPLFGVAAALTVPVTALVVWRGHVLNPILVGASGWLWVGATAFGLSMTPLIDAIAEARGSALFACAALVGVAVTAGSPAGYIGARHPDAAWVRRASLALLVATVAALAWAWVFRADLRLGSGLPFIALNVGRRVAIARSRR